jgi:uncharacterized protein (DUF111 family)
MGRTLAEKVHRMELAMKRRKTTKVVRVGDYAVEVEVVMLEDEDGWGPYLTVEDALKLEDVKSALKRGDLEEPAKLGRCYLPTCQASK